MRHILIAGNWKMNGLWPDAGGLCADIHAGLSGLTGLPEILVCPPHPLIHPLRHQLEGGPIHVGAQDCHYQDKGAFTGDVSASLLTSLGASHVIIGHSERRELHNETDEMVAAKAEAVLAQGLTAIICVGETQAQREKGQTEALLAKQLAALKGLPITAQNTVIAYEPVWAIGTGLAATPEMAEDTHSFIRRALADQFGRDLASGMRLLYGGSMKPDNAAALLAMDNIDGGLIGGASLKADDFLAIIKAAITS